MSAKSLLRAGIASPRALRSASTPKSILKRSPPSLPLSQKQLLVTGNVVVSPSLQSSHVHFPPSPGLTATFSTHSPNSYDRGAINVSPNPLELPAWGSRVYSPSTGTFEKKPAALSSPSLSSPSLSSEEEEELTPKFKTFTPPILSLGSPTIDTPPLLSPAVDKPTTRAGARFQTIAAQPSIRPVVGVSSGLGGALKSYPRSPYPTAPAPASPAPAVLAADKENSILNTEGESDVGDVFGGRVLSRTKTIHAIPPRTRDGGAGGGEGRFGTRKAKKVPPAITVIGRGAEMVFPSSPLRQEFLTPVQESPQTATIANSSSRTNRAKKNGSDIADGNAANASLTLTHAFWQSMSLDESVDMSSPLITSEDPVASGLFSPGGMISPMIFATKDGVVWSSSQTINHASILKMKKEEKKKDSAETRRSSYRAGVMSPSPEDPFSSFPSFAAALSLHHGTEEEVIAYPPPAVTVESTTSTERR